MQKGYRTKRSADRDYFAWTSSLTHKFNTQIRPMRGGYRL